MNLTAQQKNLLFAIVDGYLSSNGQEFYFARNFGGGGLSYPGGRSATVNAVEVDFRQLAEERFITFARRSGSSLSGKPTQLGIDTVALLQTPKDIDEPAAAAILGPNRPVSVLRHAGTAQETRLATRMGGDFVSHLLVLARDKVEIGDEIHCDAFAEPRVISQVDPVVVNSGLSHWKAGIEPRSEWRRRHEPPSSSGSGLVGTPEDRLSRFVQEHPGTTLADIKYSARVHTAEFQDWRRCSLKPDSVMSQRIEDVLSEATPLKKKPPKARHE